MTTTTNVEQVKLNIMTTSQYDNSSKSDTELYVLTDATAMPMDDELSLSSENPVKNSVITARSNAIQAELDDKLNKSIVWNKLNRAYGWTYRHLNGSGNAYLMYYTSANGWTYSDAYSAQNVIEDEYSRYTTSGEYGHVCLDNQLYYRTWINTNNIYTFTLYPIGINNCTCYAGYSSTNYNCAAIINNDLYYIESDTMTLKDSGGWTKISYCSLSTNYLGFGIKNDNLYYVSYLNNSTPTITLKDSGIWTDVVGFTSSSSVYGFGIRDGKLYSLNSSGITKISDDTGWSMICGRDDGVTSSSYCGYGIRDGKLYLLKGNGVSLLDTTETWIKIRGYNSNGVGLTQSGKLYRLTSTTITQIGTDTTWSDFSGIYDTKYLFGIKNGNVYVIDNITNQTFTQITNLGNIQKVYNGIRPDSSYPCGIFWTGSVTEDVHNVYTIASPAIGFDTYSNTNLQTYGTITSASLSPYTITDQFYTYTRNSSIDGVFTGISPNSSKQLMSMIDFLSCFTE